LIFKEEIEYRMFFSKIF